MTASVRILTCPALSRHLRLFNPSPRSLPLRTPNPRFRPSNDSTFAGDGSGVAAVRSAGGQLPVSFVPKSLPSGKPLFLSISFSDPPQGRIDGSPQEPSKGFRLWDPVSELADNLGGGEQGFCGKKGEIWTVVLLGWLGAEEKHLKRYADIYKVRGIRSVRFVVPLWDLVRFDFGRGVEKKVARLAAEIADWCSESEKDGRERHLLFHTFSNTGWLVYGSILQNLQSRNDVVEKIKGCVIDSGPDPEINPKVWAAGFCAALMRKRSSAICTSLESINGDNSEGNIERASRLNWKSHLLEIVSMFILEKIFNIILILPVVNQRLCAVISILSKKQPPCPQLYLYSCADTVILSSSVESFMEVQKAMGRKVFSYKFGTSPHVDHFRSFPHIYLAKVNEFLEECCSEIVCRE